MAELAKTLILIGGVIMLIGVLAYLFGKVPGVGKLPGDIYIKKENFSFYFPLTTSILLSIILSFIFYFLNRR